MKVLFAYNTEETINTLVELYKKKYGELLEVTKVYFFRSLIDTLKKESFDKIVIDEGLEPFCSKNQDVIDLYLLNYLEKVMLESGRTDIIFVCRDSRQERDEFINRLYSLGIYSVLTGKNRTFGEITKLINEPPMTPTIDKMDNFSEAEICTNEIDKLELEHILRYFEKNKFNNCKIISGFNILYKQYSAQILKQMSTFFSKEVIEVLENECWKYRYMEDKDIKYWLDSSENDYDAMKNLYRNENYNWCLFIGYLVIEKLLKALYIKINNDVARIPREDDLLILAKKANVDLTENRLRKLNVINTFYYAVRYDDYKSGFYNKCTHGYTTDQLENIEEMREWLIEILMMR